ncbi:MAG: hypothetical protein AABX50_00150 [Nanoarchaeota archaeon]
MVKKETMKMAIVAGAAAAMKYKEKNPNATESEIMNHVTQNMEKIIRDIEEE